MPNSLPQTIRVTVAAEPGLPREGLLIGLDFRLGPRDYFSTLLGLTDADGMLTIEGDDIAADFAQNQREFPMDYKLALAECDNALVGLGGGADFAERRQAALRAPVISKRAREMWLGARNTGIASDQAPIPIDGSAVTVALRARRIGIP